MEFAMHMRPRMPRRFHGYALMVALVLGVSWGLVALLDPMPLGFLAMEDGLFEWAGAFAFLGASVLFLRGFLRERAGNDLLFLRTSRNVLLLGLALLFFVGFGEEISWGQRVLGLETPAVIKEHNRQLEINIHNLGIFHGLDETGKRKSGVAIWLNIERLFSLFCLMWLLVLPLAAAASAKIAARLRRINVPLPPAWLGGVFLVNYALAKVLESGADLITAHAVVEIKESNAAFIILAAAVAITSAAFRDESAR